MRGLAGMRFQEKKQKKTWRWSSAPSFLNSNVLPKTCKSLSWIRTKHLSCCAPEQPECFPICGVLSCVPVISHLYFYCWERCLCLSLKPTLWDKTDVGGEKQVMILCNPRISSMPLRVQSAAAAAGVVAVFLPVLWRPSQTSICCRNGLK